MNFFNRVKPVFSNRYRIHIIHCLCLGQLSYLQTRRLVVLGQRVPPQPEQLQEGLAVSVQAVEAAVDPVHRLGV